uniref:ENT domain-containing protein n=1 Tax=Anopheles farauti TaxID=69004 RepID=A0A182QU95_9DIPT
MWPMKLDMTREECRGVLRRLELESYGTVISTFRAQGCLSKEKLRILESLRRFFHISNDRHRAEARRVANDERLTTIAEVISGPNSGQDWRREGHRSFPILPRTVPHTALTYIANTVCEQLTRANCKLPHPADTSVDRQKKAEELFKFELVTKEVSLFESGLMRDAAVVTSDPLQDIMSKSYINREEKCTDVPKTVEHVDITTDKPAEVSVVDQVKKMSADADTVPKQPTLCDILLNTEPTLPESNTNSTSKSLEKRNKSGERPARKKPQAAKRSLKTKSTYPPAKMSKHGSAKTVKQSSRANNLHSPHLIHSYAVPYDIKSSTNGGSNTESLQLQQHLTSSISTSSQAPQNNATGKPQQYTMPGGNFVAPSSTNNTSPSTQMYNHQQGILPSSKKDIQYNLSKLNPTQNNQSAKGGNMSVPFKGLGFYPYNKMLPHPLLNYQRKSPSKNILIPTSAAAATLASLGITKPLHLPPADCPENDWVGSKSRDLNAKLIGKSVKVVSSPSVQISTFEHEQPNIQENKPMESTTLNQPRSTLTNDVVSENVEQTIAPCSLVRTDNQPTVPVSFSLQTQSPVTNNVTRQPTIAGFTAVKGGSKVSVQKLQLVPIAGATQGASLTPSLQKNNVLILPKSSVVPGVLNLGQKITIPKKNLVDPTTVPASPVTSSPPKVIVQTVPNPYSMTTTFDMITDRKGISSLMFGDGMINSGNSTDEKANDEHGEREAQEKIPSEDHQLLNVQKQSATVSIPSDSGGAVRKITISTSQLVPFKGTLNTVSTSSSSLPLGTKKLKLTSETSNQLGAGELHDRQTSDEQEMVDQCVVVDSNVQSSESIHSEADKNVNILENEGINHTEENVNITHSNSAVDALSQAEYDVISGERGDDSSATDSADAEDDLDDEPTRIEPDEDDVGIEEDDYNERHTETMDVDVSMEMDTENIIIEEEPANYDYLIEEVPEDEQFVEEIDDEGRVEYVSVGYGTTSELVAELESGGGAERIIEEYRPANGDVVQDDLPPEIDYDQNTGGFGTVENGELHGQPFVGADGIVCDLLEMGSDGKYRARPYSYRRVIAEGMDSVSKAQPKQAHKVNPTVR